VPKGNLALNTATTGPDGFIASPGADQLLADLLLLHSGGTDFCLLGARGLGKSTLVHEFARRLGYQLETVVLYQVCF
jgi:von Willebrand factor A domain-containing protein 8